MSPERNGGIADLGILVRAAWSLDRYRVMAQMGLSAMSGVLGGAGLVLLVPIVNSVAGDTDEMTVPLFGSIGIARWPLAGLLGLFVGLVSVQALISRTSALNSARLQQRVVDRLRHQAFEAILSARWSFVLGMRRSDIVQVVTAGASRSGMAVNQVMTGTVSLVLALATAAVALVVAPLVGSVAVVLVVIMAVLQSTGVRPASRLGRQFSERSRSLQAVITDSLDSLRLVRAHDASGIWVERLADAFTSTREVQIANTERMSTIAALSSVGMAVALSSLVLGATWAGVAPASIVVMVVLVSRLTGQVRSVVSTVTQLANSLPAVGDISTLTQAAIDQREAPAGDAGRTGPLTTDPGVPIVEFRDVTFRYPTMPQSGAGGGRGAGGVHDLSFTVRRGEITALAGPSGAGKSTTADLVLGLLTPDSGTLLVGGAELTAADLSWWRRRVAYVPQETVLLPGTLRDNLVWSSGLPVVDDDLLAALEQAAAEFVADLPDGLDTVLGERGLRLSGGERQRVAIARALLRRPELLVLDEATSSLDDETEAIVLETLTGLTPAVTVLVIAHRRSTLDLADHVVRIESGRRVTMPGSS